MRKSFSTLRTISALSFARVFFNADDLSESGAATAALDTPNFDDVEDSPSADSGEETEIESNEETSKKAKKIPYPFKKDDNDNRIKLTEWPEDHDPEVHKGLLRSDFALEEKWLRVKQKEAEELAKKYAKEAETLEKLGSAEERSKAKKAQGLMNSLKSLLAGNSKEQLEAMGIDAETISEMFKDGSDE